MPFATANRSTTGGCRRSAISPGRWLKSGAGSPKRKCKAFLAAGFTKAQVLEVFLAVAFKLISNYTNQVADIPLDEAFQAYRWDGQKAA